MARLTVTIPDKVNERFRREVFRRKGMKKGNLAEAVIEAIELWVRGKE